MFVIPGTNTLVLPRFESIPTLSCQIPVAYFQFAPVQLLYRAALTLTLSHSCLMSRGQQTSPPVSSTTLQIPARLLRISVFITLLLVSLPDFFGLSSHRSKLPEARLVHNNLEMKARALAPRASPTGADACLRWSHQSALVKDTIYIYGGQARGSPDQDSDTWSRLFRPRLCLLGKADFDRQQLFDSLTDKRLGCGIATLEGVTSANGATCCCKWVSTGLLVFTRDC